MAKTTVTATRSIDAIVEEFASITDTGDLRLHQSRLAYEAIGSTEGSEAAELKQEFRIKANEALARRDEKPLSVPGVTNLVNTWKYMLRANVTPDGEVAKQAFNFASQTIAKKEEEWISPAIKAILQGADAAETFKDATKRLRKAVKERAEAKKSAAEKSKTDDGITFDSIIEVLGIITEDFFASLSDEEKSTLADRVRAAYDVVS